VIYQARGAREHYNSIDGPELHWHALATSLSRYIRSNSQWHGGPRPHQCAAALGTEHINLQPQGTRLTASLSAAKCQPNWNSDVADLNGIYPDAAPSQLEGKGPPMPSGPAFAAE
jgi:hypothetical protein